MGEHTDCAASCSGVVDVHAAGELKDEEQNVLVN